MSDKETEEAPHPSGEQLEQNETTVNETIAADDQSPQEQPVQELEDSKAEVIAEVAKQEEEQPEAQVTEAPQSLAVQEGEALVTDEESSAKRKLEETNMFEESDAKRMNAGEVEDMNGATPIPVNINDGDLPEDAPDASGQMVGYVSCPEALVSKLIGKKGTVIQALESLTGAKIQVEHQKPGDPKQVRIIAKSPEDLDKTKATIKETLESEHPLGEVTRSVSCPHAMVGRIIGRSGQTILSLQQASQAKIIVDQDPERYPEGAPRDIRIIGMAQCVERAEKMVVELMNAESGVSAQSVIQKYGLGSNRTMQCPRAMVGRVIGKQGETIKMLQRNTGANIQIDQTADPCTITVTGPNSAITYAMREISSIISDTGMGGYGRSAEAGMGAGYGGGGGGGYGGYQQQQGWGQWGGYQQPQSYSPYQGGYQSGYQGGYQQQGGYGSYGQDASYGGASAAGGGYGMAYGGAGGGAGGGAHGWTEEYDNNSQRHYYYNSVTGVTQWEKPPEMM